jgi:hypothetical protein
MYESMQDHALVWFLLTLVLCVGAATVCRWLYLGVRHVGRWLNSIGLPYFHIQCGFGMTKAQVDAKVAAQPTV